MGIQVVAKASRTIVKPGQLVRFTLILTPQDNNFWTEANLVVTLNPLLTPTNIKPSTANDGTVLTYNNVQPPAVDGNHSWKAKGRSPLTITFEARLSKQAPAGALPIAFTASISNTPVATVDVSAFGSRYALNE